MKEVKGPLLIFKCLLNWCRDTPSLHLPTLANVERDKIKERRKSLQWTAKPVHSYKAEFAAKMEKKKVSHGRQLDISHEQVCAESVWAELFWIGPHSSSSIRTSLCAC